MAYDKLVDSSVLDAGLSKIANAIREKGGASDSLAFPDAMVDAISAIEVGSGSADDVSFKEVIERTAVNPTLPSDLTKIGSYVFYYCRDLALTSLPEGVKSIDNYAFGNCTNLALTSLPDELRSIDGNAFQNCTNIAITSIPDTVVNIGGAAFSGCTGLSEITFKGTQIKINSNSFSNCTNLLIINVPWAEGAVANAPWGATNATINYNYTGG